MSSDPPGVSDTFPHQQCITPLVLRRGRWVPVTPPWSSILFLANNVSSGWSLSVMDFIPPKVSDKFSGQQCITALVPVQYGGPMFCDAQPYDMPYLLKLRKTWENLEKLRKNREKSGKIGNNWEKSGKIKKNRENGEK